MEMRGDDSTRQTTAPIREREISEPGTIQLDGDQHSRREGTSSWLAGIPLALKHKLNDIDTSQLDRGSDAERTISNDQQSYRVARCCLRRWQQ